MDHKLLILIFYFKAARSKFLILKFDIYLHIVWNFWHDVEFWLPICIVVSIGGLPIAMSEKRSANARSLLIVNRPYKLTMLIELRASNIIYTFHHMST